MLQAEAAPGLHTAHITVTVRGAAWGGVAQLRCHQWRLRAWDGLPPARLRHVVYIPGLMADYTPDAPARLLAAAWARGLPVVATVVDLPEYGASRLPRGWARRLEQAGSLEMSARLLAAVLARVVPGRYVVVGGSIGANLATLLAALDPARVAGVQLCMPAGLYSQPLVRGVVRGVLITLLLGFRVAGYRQTVWRGETITATGQLLGSLLKLPALVQVARVLARDNAVPYAARVRCPVVLVLAERDAVFTRLIPMHAAGALTALFPHAASVAVHILAGADHSGFAPDGNGLEAITLELLAEEEMG